MYKIYIKNNYIFFESATKQFRKLKTDVEVQKLLIASTTYNFHDLNDIFLVLDLSKMEDVDSNPFTTESFDEFITLNTGGGGVSFPKPMLDSGVINVEYNTTSTIQITGDYFTPDTIVSVNLTINQSTFIINSTVLKSSNLIELNVTLGDFSLTEERLVDLIIENEGGESIFADAFNVFGAEWIYLETGGTPLTIGTNNTFDIEHSADVTLSREVDGLAAVNPLSWENTIKINILSFQRGSNSTIEYIYQFKNGKNIALGIGSDSMDPIASIQYSQVESVLALQYNGIQGIRGSDGVLGVSNFLTQTVNTDASLWYKLKITNDGGLNSKFQIFQLPSSNESDWSNESNKVYDLTNTLNPNEQNLMPVILSYDYGPSRVLAVKKTTI